MAILAETMRARLERELRKQKQRLEAEGRARLAQARQALKQAGEAVRPVAAKIAANVENARHEDPLAVLPAGVRRVMHVTSPGMVVGDVIAKAVLNPKAALDEAKQKVHAVTEIAANARAQARGFEDTVLGRYANAAHAAYSTLNGYRNAMRTGAFPPSYQENLKFEEAQDDYDAVRRANARDMGRRSALAIGETASFAVDAAPLPFSPLGPQRLERMDQFLRTRDVDHPEYAESVVPIWGSTKEAVADYQDGDYVGAGFNTALAASDAFLAGRVVKNATKAGFRLPGHPKPFSQNWKAVRGRMMRRGNIAPNQHGHHWLIPQGGWGKQVPNFIKNNPLNINPMPDAATHRFLHGDINSDLWKAFKYGTPTWAKAVVALPIAHDEARAKAKRENRTPIQSLKFFICS